MYFELWSLISVDYSRSWWINWKSSYVSPFWFGRCILFSSCLPGHHKKFAHKTPTFKNNICKCVHPYSIWLFACCYSSLIKPFLKELLPFSLWIFHQNVFPYILNGNSSKLCMRLLPYKDLHIIITIWSDYFWKSYCPFSVRILHQNVCSWNSSSNLNKKSLNFECLLIATRRFTYCNKSLIGSLSKEL